MKNKFRQIGFWNHFILPREVHETLGKGCFCRFFLRWMPIILRKRVRWNWIANDFRYDYRGIFPSNSCRVRRKIIRGCIFDLQCVVFCSQFSINIEFEWVIVGGRFFLQVFQDCWSISEGLRTYDLWKFQFQRKYRILFEWRHCWLYFWIYQHLNFCVNEVYPVKDFGWEDELTGCCLKTQTKFGPLIEKK